MNKRTNEQSDGRAVGPTYPCGDPPEAGVAVEIAPDVLWIRMPLPFALTHVNLWAIKDSDGWVLVDTGLQTEETAAVWNNLFAGPLNGLKPTRVLVTHMHPDHVGMAGWLTRKFGCRLWMTRLKYLSCRTLAADTGREAPEDGVRFYRRAGWGDDAITQYRARFGNFGKRTYVLPDSYRRIEDCDLLMIGSHGWRVVVGSGHSPEHACLYCPDHRLFISGDQVLPRISSDVSVSPTEPEADPLGEWMASLEKIKREVPDDVLVLPAHNEPFRGHERLDHLLLSQTRALDRLRIALEQPKRAVDVFSALFARKISYDDTSLLSLATGESIAHLNYLIRRGVAFMTLDDDGVAWYRAS